MSGGRKITSAGVAIDGRNPLLLEYNRLTWTMVNPSWVSEMCAEHGTECEHPLCTNSATQAFMSMYSCSFICDYHAMRMDNSETGKILRIITGDEIDIYIFELFMSRSFTYLDRKTNGMMSALSKQQLMDLKRLDAEDRDREHNIRMRIRRMRKSSSITPGMPAHVAYQTEVGDDKWMAIQFDPRKKLNTVVIPAVLATHSKFAPELHNLPENKSGLDDVEEVF